MLRKISAVFVTFVIFFSTLFYVGRDYFFYQPQVQKRTVASIDDFYTQKVQNIFNQRCVACHSCLESPCQLNLQSYEGVRRGAIQNYPVYDGGRFHAIKPTRIFEDAQSVYEWREKGFFDVIGDSKYSLLSHVVDLGAEYHDIPTVPVGESQICPNGKTEMGVQSTAGRVSQLSMPYGLPALQSDEIATLKTWILTGAQGPRFDYKTIPIEYKKLIRDWEAFLNGTDLKSKITARYIFEHLFLAHLYFKETPEKMFRLVRSKTKCDFEIQEIATRNPNDNPFLGENKDQLYYCFKLDFQTRVYKNLIPYELSNEKLNWLKKIFIDSPWIPKELPSYSKEIASNPFKAFRDIPVKSRYEFLLQDARYHVMTFIKGPVCNGTRAVNSIQEQFYVFFMNPDSELMAKYPEYATAIEKQLDLPGGLGSETKTKELFKNYKLLMQKRNEYRHLKNSFLKSVDFKGFDLNDIWNGNGTNQNALLTVFRHDDNAYVSHGAVGAFSKTAFVLDYSVLERLVYNLVVNFDVFGDVGHQALTRLYMDFLRMDAENNFLEFLPLNERMKLKKQWYHGTLTEKQLEYFDELQFSQIESKILFSENNHKKELFKKIIFERLNEKVRGPVDYLNHHQDSIPDKFRVNLNDKIDLALREISGIPLKFVRYMPEFSYLVIMKKGIPFKSYSMIHNREHDNVSWILGESFRLSPEEDTLTLNSGFLGAYPNQFFAVEESQLSEFINDLKSVKSNLDYMPIFNRYSIERMNGKFWMIYDFLNQEMMINNPVSGGFLDLSRYYL